MRCTPFALLLAAAGPASAGWLPAEQAAAAAGHVREAYETARVRGLIEKLAAPAYRDREAAGAALGTLGDRALPAMKHALKTTPDPEVNRRLEVLVRKIGTDVLVSPKRVTYIGLNVTAKAAVAEIARQTGYDLFVGDEGRGGKVRLTVNWDRTPYWQAVDEVCNAAGFVVNPENEDGGRTTFYNQDAYNPHVGYSGPFRLVATNIGSNRSIQLSSIPRQGPPPRNPESLNFNFQIQSEPKNPIVGTGTPVVTKAVDETGASLAPPPDDDNTRTSYYAPYMYRGFSQYVGVTLVRSNRNATTLKEVRGKVTVLMLADSKPDAVVDNLLAAKKKKVPGRTAEVEVESVVEAAPGILVNVTVKQNNPNPNDYSWNNSVYQRLEVTDDAGQKWVSGGVSNQNYSPGAVTLAITFNPPPGKKAGKPAKLQFVEWVTYSKEVEFAFKDVPLP